MRPNNDNFKFFIPLEFEKAKNSKTGQEDMCIKGIASTADRDSDGEILDPSGFELDYFLKNGFVNWHHQSKNDPNAVIGEPTKASITKGGLYIEALLYKDSELAKKVWDLAQTLEKSGSNRRLGFSIEGKVLERDTLDDKYVKKAKITGVAVTPSPKNSNTLVDIIKGEYSDWDDSDDLYAISDNSANGGTVVIVDVVKPNGDRLIVDKNYNIKVISKSMTTANSAGVIKEDIEPGIKNLQENKKNLEKGEQVYEEVTKFTPINKFDIFSKALEFVEDIDTAKKIADIVCKTLKNENMAITEQDKVDEIKKSLDLLGIQIDPEILKGAMLDEEEAEKKEDAVGTDGAKKELPPVVKKKDSETDDDDDDDDEDEMEKALVDKQKELDEIKQKIELRKAKNTPAKVEVNIGADEIKKSLENEIRESSKQIEAKTTELVTNANEQFSKGISEIKDMFSEFKKGIEEKFENIERQSLGRKSVVTSRALEKSFGGEEQANAASGKTVVSISRQRGQVSSILMAKSGIEKGEVNDFYVNEITKFEATGQISKAAMDDLNVNSNILIVQ